MPSELTRNTIKKAILITFLFFSYFLLVTPIKADEISIDSLDTWNTGFSSDLTNVTEGTGLEIKADGSWGALSWKHPEYTITVGAAFTTDGTDIYVARGYGDNIFMKYIPTTDTWEQLSPMPGGMYYGSDLQYLDGYIYAIFGAYQRTFARYSVENNEWEELEEYPDLTYYGSSLTADDTDIYAVTGNNTQSFYKYDISENTWNLLASTPSTLRYGASLERVGDYIYTPRGNNTTTFYRYTISSNTWDTMAAAPGTLRDDFEITNNGTDIFVARQYNTTTFYKYNIASNTWSTLTSAPMTSRYAGVQYLPADGYIYFFRGNGDRRFWKYDIAQDEFVGPKDTPATLSTGANMIYDNGYVYTPRGSNTTTYYRYTVATNTWDTMTAAPSTFNDDTKGVVVNGYIYYYRGANTTTFYRYNIAGNSWDEMAVTPYNVRFGGSLAYPGSGDYIYGTRGATTNYFWRYSISTDTWDYAGVANLPSGVYASYGARLLSNGTDLYFTSGVGTKRFFKYEISSDTWTELTRLPFASYYGTDTVYDGNGKILALAGWYETDFWEYNISTDTWRKLPNYSGYGSTEVGSWNGASIVHLGGDDFLMSRGGARQDILMYTRGTSDYKASGTWTSPIYNLNYVASWQDISTSTTTPSDSSVLIETRTSDDGSTWDTWETVTSNQIQSATKQYLQTKVTLVASLDKSQTSKISSLDVPYTSDTTPPGPPQNIVAKSQEVGGDTLTNGETYTHTNPSFSWDAAIDTHTTISGYYVYLGTNNSADPTTDGVFQTTLKYTVTGQLTAGSNYLRIVSEDIAGNKSTATTLFTYEYDGIAPALTLEIDNDDLAGTTTDTQVTANGIKLGSVTEGFWLENRLTQPPVNLGYGAKNVAYDADQEKFYLASGMNNQFYEYDLTADTWTRLADAPDRIYYGGGSTLGPDGYIYITQGQNTTNFWRYNTSTDTWETDISPTPLTISYGGTTVYDGEQYIYQLRGNNSDFFWRYDTFSDVWESLAKIDFGTPTDAVNNNVYTGATLAIDITNKKIYASQGNNRAGFSIYDIDMDTWTPQSSLPITTSYGSSLDYHEPSQTLYYMGGNYNAALFKYDTLSEEWTQVNSAPYGFYYGGNVTVAGNYLYAIRGGNSRYFYKYDIEKNSWLMPRTELFGTRFENSSSVNSYYGADLVKGDGNNYYISRGYYADNFVRWNEETGEVQELASLPSGAYNGSSMTYDSTQNRIYFTGGQYNWKFHYYDIDTNSWTEEVDDPLPLSVNAGSSMIYDGSQYIYLTRASGQRTLYRFDTQGTAGNKWTTMTNAPSTLQYGSELTIDNGYLYTMRGYNSTPNPLYRYNISSDTWDTLTSMPDRVYNDGLMVNGQDGNLYVARANNTSTYYKYTIATDSWTQLPNFPGQIYAGGAADTNGTNSIYVLSGNGSYTYQDALYTYVMPTQNSAFNKTGSYESQSHDLTSVYKWAGIELDYDLNDNTNLVIETATSPDDTEWTGWSSVTKKKEIDGTYTYKINSPTDRYIKVRFSLSSGDGILSPVVRSYNINYYQDLNSPTNPDTSGLDPQSAESGGEELTTNTWYNHELPVFTWDNAGEVLGASDGVNGSGVAGYYVYWGSDDEADPETEGSLQTEISYTPSNLEDATTYYLRVKTVDNADNVSSNTWQPFIYKYDASGPDPVDNLTADPSGYTAIDDFSFSWDSVTTSGAQITEYCYKTDATEGPFATEQCTTETEVSNVTSYRVGSNTFYVRAKDEAGNYGEYATVYYFYVDSANAPAPPLNLQVAPVNNTENSFGFTWDPPAEGTFYGSESNLSYMYSVNALPTEFSTSQTSLRYLNPGAYATLPGENKFYIVTKDEAGNVNYNNYATISFYANTIAPGIPTNIEIADVSVKDKASWRLAVSWDEPEEEGSGVAGYQIYRSVDGENYFFHSYTSGSSLVDSKLVQVTHYYKVKACDSTNNCGAFSEIVELFPDGRYTQPAELIISPIISDVTPRKATVSWVTARTADSRVAYGTEPGAYFEEEVSNSDQVVDHILTINNLNPGTKYYYITKWTDEDGNTGISEEGVFETQPPPSIEEPIVKRVSLNSALIEFKTKDTLKVRILYGETSSFGGMIEVYTGSAEGTHNVEIADIKDGTKYFYKINTFDIDGAEYEGEIHSFETLPRPQILDPKIYQVTGTSSTTLLVEWEVNTPVSSVVTYFPSNKPEYAMDDVNVALEEGTHRMVLMNLEANTTYSVIISGRDFMGNEATSEVIPFTTATDTRPPQIYDLDVTSEIIGSGQEATAQLVVSYKTDEPATAQIEYSEGTGTTYAQKSQEDTSLSNNHITIISGLTPSKVYHLRAISKDAEGNEGHSIDKVVVTSASTEDAFNLAVQNLVSIFSFLGGN